MSRKLIIAMAILSFAFAGTTFAAVENIKVSGDINTEAVTRDLSFGNSGSTSTNDEQYLFSQIRVKLDADLTEGVSAVISLLNERIWGEEANDNVDGNTELALDLAYVELQEFLYEPLTLVVGRQNLRFGNALIIGDPDTNRYASDKVFGEIRDLSLRKSFDAVRGILDFAPWTIDVIYAKVEENALHSNDDVTVIGANAAYDWSSYNGVTEAYFYSVDNSPRPTTASTADSKDKVYVLGSRAHADLNDNLTLGLEGAYQFGDYRVVDASNHRHLNAFAVQAMAEYRLLDAKNTKLGMNYTYLSGDNDNGDGPDISDDAYNGWNPLFEDQSPGEVINILFDNTNMQYWQLSASTMPQEDITLGIDYIYARLAQDNKGDTIDDGNSGGKINVNRDDKEIGHEIDLYGVYDYTEDVQLKLTGGWLIPGNLFADSNDNVGYSLRAGMNVNF